MTSGVPAYNILHKVVPITFDATGTGIATSGPVNVNEYWAPLVIRVATKSTPPPRAQCTVYHGATGVRDFTTYLDDTNTGNSDTTTICAGVTMQYGEIITAVWTGGQPNDNAVLIIDGILTNTPPNLAQLPQVPGTHFAGKGAGETTITLIDQTAGVSVGAGGGPTTAIIDVREFNSYYLKCFAADSGGATQFDTMEVQIQWFSDAAGTVLLYGDYYQWFANTSFGSGFFGGPVIIQDAMHGPFMQLNFNNRGTVTQTLQYILIGSTRSVPNASVRQGTFGNPTIGFDGVLVNNLTGTIGGGGSVQLPLTLGYGELSWTFFNNGANSMDIFLGWGSTGTGGAFPTTDLLVLGLAAGGVTIGNRLIYPKRAGIFTIKGTATQTFAIKTTTNFLGRA